MKQFLLILIIIVTIYAFAHILNLEQIEVQTRLLGIISSTEIIVILLAALLAYEIGKKQNKLVEMNQGPFISIEFDLPTADNGNVYILPKIKNLGGIAIKDLEFCICTIILDRKGEDEGDQKQEFEKPIIRSEGFQDKFINDLYPKQEITFYYVKLLKSELPKHYDGRVILFLTLRYRNLIKRKSENYFSFYHFYDPTTKSFFTKPLFQSDYEHIYEELLKHANNNIGKNNKKIFQDIVGYLKKRPFIKK